MERAISATTTPITPTIGGILADFQQRFGTATDSSGLMYAATIAGQRALVLLTFDDPSQRQDGQQHMAIIAGQVPGDALGAETWSQATADHIAQTFLPSDAQFQHFVTTGKIHDHIYDSAILARTFSADQFTNDIGAVQVPPGHAQLLLPSMAAIRLRSRPVSHRDWELCGAMIHIPVEHLT